MVDNRTLQLWCLLPISPAEAPGIWACSRFDGRCEVVARNERQARLQAAGAFCLPVAPGLGEAVCPWLSPEHVLAELMAPAVSGPVGIVTPGPGLVVPAMA